MTTDASQPDRQKITVILPVSLLKRLDERISSRKRSRFIAEAIEQRLALEEQIAVLDETAGAWSDANHPDMQDDEDIDRWIADLRRSWVQAEAA